MPNNVIYPRPQFVNSSGVPLASGTLSTYAAGTTTPKATYPTEADMQAGTNPNATSLTLNANGSPSVDLWLNGSYKFVVADSTGAIVYTSDKVNDPDSQRDANGNILFSYNSVASPVNYIQASNAATNNPPILNFTGSDANVNGRITCKGSGQLTIVPNVIFSGTITPPGPTWNIPANASQSSALVLNENTSNGANTLTITAPNSFASNMTWTFPSTTANGILYNQAGTLSSFSGYVVKQIISATLTGTSTATSTTFNANSGTSVGTASITPTSATSTIFVMVSLNVTVNTTGLYYLNVVGGVSGTTVITSGNNTSTSGSAENPTITVFGTYTSGGTGAQTISAKMGAASGTATTGTVQAPSNILILELVNLN